MGRPPSDLADDRQWQQRLQRYQTTELNLDVFCLQEGVSRSTFYRWKQRLDEDLMATSAEPPELNSSEHQRPETNESLFLPISLKSSRVEIELPNGGVVRLPGDAGKDVLVAVVRVVGSLRPQKAPPSRSNWLISASFSARFPRR